MQKQDEYIHFSQPLIGDEEIAQVVEALRSGWLSTGPKTQLFEEKFAHYAQARHAIALNSCTAGLHLCLVALGIGPGDQVITTPFTFCSTANVIEHVGAQPVFVDIRPDTMNINPDLLQGAINKKTRAIIPVHYGGRPCEMDAIIKIAEKNGLPIIEDAAHCTEGKFKGRKIGSIGNFTCFSFYATKNLCTGEGGMITLDDSEMAEKLKILRLHGLSADAWNRYHSTKATSYTVSLPGYKYNMPDMAAALGLAQLEKIEKNQEKRRQIWERYDQALSDLPLILPAPVAPGDIHARHLYTVLVDRDNCSINRDQLRQRLGDLNIGTSIHFPALHLADFYRKKYGFKPQDFPITTMISENILSLPFSPALSDSQIDRVIDGIKVSLKGS